jgi:8-oxo-dGTP pyrophosphatase MutT (NUDIX family)/cation transport regulator ChaC
MKEAVVMIARRGSRFLGVSRRDDPSAFGLPGGKVDPGEDAKTAARRELFEETGLRAGRLTPIFQQQEGHFLVTAFLTTVSGEVSPQTGETGVVAWVDRETLCSGPFGEFNAAMFAAMDDAADEVREIGKRRNPSSQPPDYSEPHKKTDTPAFRRWFGDSEVVDEKGEPLVVYHGTDAAGFYSFDQDFFGRSDNRVAFFFTSSRKLASTYVDYPSDKLQSVKLRPLFETLEEFLENVPEGFEVEEYVTLQGTHEAQLREECQRLLRTEEGVVTGKLYHVGIPQGFGKSRWMSYTYYKDTESKRLLNDVNNALKNQRGSPGIYEVYLRIENPLIIDAEGSGWHSIPWEELDENLDLQIVPMSTNEIAAMAKNMGHDGVIFKNLKDSGPSTYDYNTAGDVYAVFEPTQIKSVSNRGTWDTTDPVIINPTEPRRRTPTRQHPVYLFCYGSNNTKQLQSRLSIPGGSRGSVQGAYAPGYQRVFRGMSRKWGGGTASLEKKRSATTYGLVVELLPQDLEKLDRYEGVHSGVYKRQTITVYTQDGEELEAIAYVSLKKQFNPPTEEYLDAVAETISMFWEGSRGPVTADDIPIR